MSSAKRPCGRGRFQKSRLMDSDAPFSVTWTTSGQEHELLADIIVNECTCSPIVHYHDAGIGPGVALLHDPWCARLEALKGGTN